ncbi:hypothetical protein Ddye_015829 [Dipteronia dyeriana]|uniref:Endonuclease/exonuclease/phosphatase domain-containing protein n=1 Tax=Dipteronia dyeriana TaxID=168575 RepID=A0AAD9U6D8_9ROSI|nr:hypothetical protein Ddye_015829 [Dipteronia dyeriana]
MEGVDLNSDGVLNLRVDKSPNSQNNGSFLLSPSRPNIRKWKRVARQLSPTIVEKGWADDPGVKRKGVTIEEDVREGKKSKIDKDDSSNLGSATGIMKILCWNVRGMGNPRTLIALKNVLKRKSLYLVFLFETRLKASDVGSIKRQLGYEGCFQVNCVGGSGGLLLFWKEDWKVSITSFSTGHIDARVSHENGVWWRFSGIYGCPGPNQRHNTWELIRRLRMVDNLPWVLGGDFNERLRMDEKCGGLMKAVSGMYDFWKIVDNYNLMDLGFAGPKMTWDNKREGRDNIQERLDHFFGDRNWVETFSNTKVEYLGFNFLDHRPILLSLEVARKDCWETGDKGFLFESFWLKDEKCTKIVEEVWNNYGRWSL